MKYPALAPPIGGQVIIVVNLLNHEKSRGRTSSAASCLKEDVMAPRCSVSNASWTQHPADLHAV
ncbi:MAG: hypothetical protein CMA79_05940 [Euryarchaeota archaeon]|nr:hypothetical protein [Euryarchaeota archaeon]